MTTGNALDKKDANAEIPKLSELQGQADCVKLINTAGRISFMGEQGLLAMELDSLSDVVGKVWWEFWPDAIRDEIKGRFEAALAGEVQQFRAWRRMAKGTEKEWSVILSPVPSITGAPTSVLVLSRDVTPKP